MHLLQVSFSLFLLMSTSRAIARKEVWDTTTKAECSIPSNKIKSLSADKNIFCYFASWTFYRNGNGNFNITNIDPFLCTHISFAFIGLTDNGTVSILDPWESNEDYGPKGFESLVGLKQQNSKLKVLISLGGWNEGSQKYSAVAADPAKRQVLAQDVLKFIETWSFDGLDLDWEYPGFREGANATIDRDDYTALLRDLKAVLNPKGYLLTAAVSGSVERINIAYDVVAIADTLDMINVMVYDFHGHFEPFVGHPSALYASSLDKSHGNNVTLNVAKGIENYLDYGVDPAKINLGIATYGRSFTLKDKTDTSLYAPIIGGGKAGPYTGMEGILGYNEICELYSDWTYVWDDEQKVPHKINEDQWVGYEDDRSVQLKAEYAKSKRMGGMMVWAFDTDDFRGLCGEEYILMKTIRRHFL